MCQAGKNERKKKSKKNTGEKAMPPRDRNFFSPAVGQVTDVTTGTIFVGRSSFDPIVSSWFILLLSNYCVLVVNLHSAEKRKRKCKICTI